MHSTLVLLRRPLAHVFGLSLFFNLLLLVPALFMLQVFDRVLASQSVETLVVLVGGTAIALVIGLVLDYLRSRLQGVSGALLADSLSPRVTRIAIERAAQRSERALPEGLRDVATLRGLFSAQGLLALFDLPWAPLYIAVIWLAHPWLGLAAAASAVLMLVLAIANDRLTRRDIESLQRAASGATRYVESSLQNAEVAQTMGMTESLIARWRVRNAEVVAMQRGTARRSVAMAALTRTTRQSIQIAILALGAWLVITGQATPGVMIATTVLLGRALAPIEQIVGNWKVLAEGRAAYRRIAEALDAQDAKPAKMALPAPSGALSASGLTLRSPKGDRMLVAGVTLRLEAGQSLAIIGPSGAGKSTLVRLLTGLWAPSAGTVRLDDADLSQWPRGDLGRWIGYVPQDVELFPGTVAENIARLGDVDAARVVEAAQRAHAHELILSLPDGYDTVVEPASSLLSPGQRQRIALARALYGAPRLLVLDEPNSNLDGTGELALAETLKALRGTVTVIVVTHRTTLVQHVDRVMVLEGGRVVQHGPTAEVMHALSQGGAQVVAMPRPAAVPPTSRVEPALHAGAAS